MFRAKARNPILAAIEKHDLNALEVLCEKPDALLEVKQGETLIRTFAKKENIIEILKIAATKYSKEDFEKVSAEVIQGAKLGNNEKLLTMIKSEALISDDFYNSNIWYAELELGKYGYDDISNVVTGNKLFEGMCHMVRGPKSDDAIKLLADKIKDYAEHPAQAEFLRNLINKFLHNAALNPKIKIKDFALKCSKALITQEDKKNNFMGRLTYRDNIAMIEEARDTILKESSTKKGFAKK